MKDKQHQWDGNLKDIWHGKPILAGKPANDVKKMFECYVHDSRAWFKALLAKDGRDLSATKTKMVKSILGLDGYELAPDDEDWFTLGGREKEQAAQKAALEEKLAELTKKKDWLGQKKTEDELTALKENGPLVSGGREPYRLYGYLRFRKTYQCGQLNDAYTRKRQEIIQQDENDRRKQQRIEAEKARHAAERKRILDNDHRVIGDKSMSPRVKDDYLYGSRQSMDRENTLHADNLKAVE